MMRVIKTLFFVAVTFLFSNGALADDNDDNFDPMRVDVRDAITCKIDAPTYNSFALSIGDDYKKRGWKKVKSDNPFLNEYVLAQPINVAGLQTNRIAFSASAVMAVLDLADPSIAAKPEGIINEADPAALFDDLQLTPQQIAEIPKTDKFMGQKILTDVTEKEEGLSFQTRTVIARTISNVSTLPGKTLYGCSYRIEILDKNGQPI
jgi:hypothetical protein